MHRSICKSNARRWRIAGSQSCDAASARGSTISLALPRGRAPPTQTWLPRGGTCLNCELRLCLWLVSSRDEPAPCRRYVSWREQRPCSRGMRATNARTKNALPNDCVGQHTPKKRCKTQPIAHPSARKATRVRLIPPATAHDICAPRKPRYAKISGSTYRCDSCRAHSCELARADRRRSRSNDCGARPLESTRETRSPDEPRSAHRSRKKTPLF